LDSLGHAGHSLLARARGASPRALLACLVLAATGPRASAAPAEGLAPLRAVRASGPVDVDGSLAEPAWAAAPAFRDFLQRDPDQGRPATEPTEVRFLYDDHALYVGARLGDGEPARIARQLSRRDAAAEADTFTVYLDPERDGRTGVVLQVSAAGVQRDAAIYDDNFEDDTWDAVWESAVRVDAGGWTVEMRVPLSQLRFPTAPGHRWGVNVRRVVHRKAESDWLALVPKNESGLASRMAPLEGLDAVAPGRHLDLLPYVSGRMEYVEPVSPGDPWNDGSRPFGGAGLDFRYGLGTGMSLVGAVNPDFGQVEVDPAVVNLTAFETFFEEKRPFFTEGSQVFLRFGRSGAADYTTYFYPEPLLFYSRRIGRAPQLTATGDYVDAPQATTILGAGKLVGRTKNGWSLGVLEALTGRESARVMTAGQSRDVETEPLTNYFVARAQRALGARASIGLIGTSVLRDARTEPIEALLPQRAFVGGFDGHVFLDGRRDWVLSGGLSASTVSGTSASILRLQRAAQRYYQRPDAPHVSVDPAATSLSGWSGRLGLNRNRGNVTFNAGLWNISPGFEPNDLGYATQTDRGGAHAQVLFRRLTPDRWTRTRRLAVAKWWTFNDGGESQGDGVQATASAQARNYWQLDLTLGKSWNTWDDKLTRGGPTTIRPGIENMTAVLTSDARKRVWLQAQAAVSNREFGSRSRTYTATVNLRPFSALTLTAQPTYLRAHTVAQYLSTVPDSTATATFGARYVFGTLDQDELSVPLRVSYVLSPRLSLQVYLQALHSKGDYPLVRQLAAPRTYDFPVFGQDQGTIDTLPDGSYVLDADGEGPSSPFRIARPDFDVRSLRVNAVLRWEFRPGSSLYAVWTQRRQGQAALTNLHPDDVVMLKLAWWIGR